MKPLTPNHGATIRVVPFAILLLGGIASAAPPAAPTNLIFFLSESPQLGTIQWEDNSDNETEFFVEFKVPNSPTFSEFNNRAPADSTTFSVQGFTPGAPFTFRVRASNADGFSDYSNEAVVVTESNFQIAASCVTVTPGDDFSHKIETNFDGDVSPASPLPEWMSWDAENQTLSGQSAPAGIVTVPLEALNGPHYRTRDFFVQVINEPPVSAGDPAEIDLTDQPGGLPAIQVDLTLQFNDPDFGRAAAMNTPFGPINIGLYDDPVTGAPLTVANFFAYAEANRWNGTFFHRSIEKFVIQGGGYVPDGITEGTFLDVESFAPIQNEFSAERPNYCGTISMAKLGGNPNSATSEWFFSVNDNRANLDNQNGGFTVFGRAAGMDVIDQISAFDTGSYNIILDGIPRNFTDWPLSAISVDSPLVSELASMSSVVEIPTLEFSVESGSPAVATASLENSQLTITPNGPGRTEIVVTATDLDGASVSATWKLTVSNTYNAWAARGSLDGENSAPLQNRDSGPLANLQEYAFGGDPLDAADDQTVSPMPTTIEANAALVFRHRKHASDLTYTVQTSTDLVTWTDLWTTADGNTATPVAALEDLGQFWQLTVRPTPANAPIYFRVVTTLTE